MTKQHLYLLQTSDIWRITSNISNIKAELDVAGVRANFRPTHPRRTISVKNDWNIQHFDTNRKHDNVDFSKPSFISQAFSHLRIGQLKYTSAVITFFQRISKFDIILPESGSVAVVICK